MGLLLFVQVLVLAVANVHSMYVALAPGQFHPGYKYTVRLTVHGVTSPGVRVTVHGNIFNSKKQSLGAGSVSLNSGESAILKIQVADTVLPDPEGIYHLQLDGAGGIIFSNSTTIHLAPITHLTFIQTDKKIYKAGQLIRFRVLAVDKDLLPRKVPKNITIENPHQSALAKFYCDGTKAVYENTYQLTEFPGLGNWKIVVKSSHGDIHEEIAFTVDEYVLPKFEVTAEVTPGILVKHADQDYRVMLEVTAKYTYGKGVLGDIKITLPSTRRTFNSKITDSSGKKDIELSLEEEVELAADNITIKVEVTDETQRTYETTVKVHVRQQSSILEFDRSRTDLVYRVGLPFHAVITFVDGSGQPLSQDYLESDLTVTWKTTLGVPRTKVFDLSPGMTEVHFTAEADELDLDRGALSVKASLLGPDDKTYNAGISVPQFHALGNTSLNARLVNNPPVLSVGSNASFVVDTPSWVNFTSITYMIVSRGSVQASGYVMAGETSNVKVTTDMCPEGKLVVYGITSPPSTFQAPEILADSLVLKLDHCLDKKVTPSVESISHRTGTTTNISLGVTWTDASDPRAVGQHDMYVLAVDKSLLLLQGDNDIQPERIKKSLKRFHLPRVADAGTEAVIPDQDAIFGEAVSTGDLLRELGFVVVTDVDLLQPDDDKPFPPPQVPMETINVGPREDTVVRKNFPETWLWNTVQTDFMGRASIVAKLPDTITSWVVSAFAVRADAELAITAQPLELNVFNPFFISLNLPYAIRRTEKFELRATVFNYDTINVDTTVILAPSDDYIISGDSTQAAFVKSNSAGSVTFVIVASKVGVITLRVTATARRSNGATMTDMVERKLIVKPEGVERMRAVTFPVVLSAEQAVFEQTVTIDFSPWKAQDVVKDSTRVKVKVTGNMMGNALEDIDKLVTMPTGCGEQNMVTTVPNVYAMTYLTAINELNMMFETKAKQYMKLGYTRETQQYRWDTGDNAGGYSAFGTSDQAASTWLTAFVLRSFAHARLYIPDTVDMDILNSAVDFLVTRHNNVSGLFFELGQVLHQEMQGGTGAGDALSVYVTVAMMEAEKYGVDIDSSRLDLAVNYVKKIANGERVTERPFLAAITAYALALRLPANPDTHTNVLRLIGYIISSGAPWRKQQEPQMDQPTDSVYFRRPPGPSDIEVTAYCILAFNTIGKVNEARELVLWLQKQQNSNGGFRSTQDTVMALQAISEYSVNFVTSGIDANVKITTLYPVRSTKSVNIDTNNAAMLQLIELPDDTTKVNIRVAGTPNSLALVKVVWHFYTAPDTKEMAPRDGDPMSTNGRILKMSTETSIVRPGIHNVKACIKPEAGLDYNNMMVMTLDMPSGFQPQNLQEARKQNPNVVRLEQDSEKLHLYMTRPREECVNVAIEETARVDNLKPGAAQLYAYYEPDIKSEAQITVGQTCTDGVCRCTGGNCDPSIASTYTLSHLPLLLSVCLLAVFLV
ncbi:CD109 antigen-like [Littorina saxatilis]|uniref:CD109 antigen-like n=1 Tax=Littorina saxatilis TaxID=31220 RepID=UPI0038B4A9BB